MLFRSLDQPFILHNVDVISNIDLGAMVARHAGRNALATLAVQERKSSRLLVFNDEDQLCGRRIVIPSKEVPSSGHELEEMAASHHCAGEHALAFSGIHVISSQIFSKMPESGAFSIIDAYLKLAARGEKIVAFRADGSYWRDLGRPESLVAAENDVARGI